VILHDCTGPVSWASAVHTGLHLPNLVMQECVRAYVRDIYPQIVSGLPTVSAGVVHPGPGVGHGVELTDSYTAGARSRRSGRARDGRWRDA
jgi:L-alanine-DL-glutamate epimerase-like enolase superfamily enzyme